MSKWHPTDRCTSRSVGGTPGAGCIACGTRKPRGRGRRRQPIRRPGARPTAAALRIRTQGDRGGPRRRRRPPGTRRSGPSSRGRGRATSGSRLGAAARARAEAGDAWLTTLADDSGARCGPPPRCSSACIGTPAGADRAGRALEGSGCRRAATRRRSPRAVGVTRRRRRLRSGRRRPAVALEPDRHLRYAARQLLRRVNRNLWRDAALAITTLPAAVDAQVALAQTATVPPTCRR